MTIESFYTAGDIASAVGHNDATGLNLGVKVIPINDATLLQGRVLWPIGFPAGLTTYRVWDNAGNLLATGTHTEVGTEDGTYVTFTLDNTVAMKAGATYWLTYSSPLGAYNFITNLFPGPTLTRGHLIFGKSAFDNTPTGWPGDDIWQSGSYVIDGVFDVAPDGGIVTPPCPCSAPLTGTNVAFMQMVVDCALLAIDNSGDLTINRHGIVLGDVAWDDCQCGQLVIKEDRRYGSTSFPVEEVSTEDDCGEPWLVTVYTLSLARCAPMPDDNGNPPAVSALATAATQLSKDMSAIRHAVMCCLDTQYRQHTLAAWQLGAQEINGPQGGCLETTLQILVGTPQDCGC